MPESPKFKLKREHGVVALLAFSWINGLAAVVASGDVSGYVYLAATSALFAFLLTMYISFTPNKNRGY